MVILIIHPRLLNCYRERRYTLSSMHDECNEKRMVGGEEECRIRSPISETVIISKSVVDINMPVQYQKDMKYTAGDVTIMERLVHPVESLFR